MSNEQVHKWLIESLSQEKGYFGRVNTWGQRPNKYEYVGYELDGDFAPVLENMSVEKRKALMDIIFYFVIHADPLKKMLECSDEKISKGYPPEWAWSHFMTVVMFGMLEVAVKNTPSCIVWRNQKKGHIEKYKSIELFLETYLPQNIKAGIAKRYKTENNETLGSFSDVLKHLWEEIRSGFIHDAGIHFKGTEWTTFKVEDEKNVIAFQSDVPMQELLQMTWQAILNSFGYQGLLKLPRYKD